MTEYRHNGWLVYRIKEGKVDPYGVLESESKAREEIANLGTVFPNDKWEMRIVSFIGWGVAMAVSNAERADIRGAN